MQDAGEMQDWLTGQVARQLGRPADEIRPDTLLSEYGLDSVAAVRLSADIEDHCGLPVDPVLLWDNPTIGELAACLAGRLAGDGRG